MLIIKGFMHELHKKIAPPSCEGRPIIVGTSMKLYTAEVAIGTRRNINRNVNDDGTHSRSERIIQISPNAMGIITLRACNDTFFTSGKKSTVLLI